MPGRHVGGSDDGAPALTLRDSTVTRAAGAGLALFGGAATVERSVLSDNAMPATSHIQDAEGIFAQDASSAAGSPPGAPARLTLRDSAVEGNSMAGISLANTTATVERSAVRATRVARVVDLIGAEKYHELGVGLMAGTYTDPTWTTAAHPPPRGSLVLRDSLVHGSSAAGLWLSSLEATLTRSRVRQTGTARGLYGDGVEAVSSSSGQVKLTMEDCLVESSARAGLLVEGGGGTVRRSVLRRGIFSIVLEGGADLAFGQDNVFEDNQEDRATFGLGLEPVPILALPAPPQLPGSPWPQPHAPDGPRTATGASALELADCRLMLGSWAGSGLTTKRQPVGQGVARGRGAPGRLCAAAKRRGACGRLLPATSSRSDSSSLTRPPELAAPA